MRLFSGLLSNRLRAIQAASSEAVFSAKLRVRNEKSESSVVRNSNNSTGSINVWLQYLISFSIVLRVHNVLRLLFGDFYEFFVKTYPLISDYIFFTCDLSVLFL